LREEKSLVSCIFLQADREAVHKRQCCGWGMGCFDDDAFSSAQLSQPALLLLSASGNPQALWTLNRPSPMPVAHRQLRTPSPYQDQKGRRDHTSQGPCSQRVCWEVVSLGCLEAAGGGCSQGAGDKPVHSAEMSSLPWTVELVARRVRELSQETLC